MEIERHAPSTPVLMVTIVLAVLALIGYFTSPYTPAAFFVAILAVLVMVFGTLVKT